MHLAQQCCHCLEHFWNSYCGIAVSVITFFLCLQYPYLNLHSFKADFIFGNSQKSPGAKSGERGWHSISVIDFWGRNCLTESTLQVGTLLRWRIQSLGQTSGTFLHTASVFHMISLVDFHLVE